MRFRVSEFTMPTMAHAQWGLLLACVLLPASEALAQGSPHVRNLEGFAERIRSQRCNLLVVGDSISTHFSSSARGTWVTAIWKEWKPDQWRGRFFPTTYHVHIPNGTWVYDYGASPSLDPNCNAIIDDLPAYPGQDLGGEFGSGWWGNFINAFETTGDLDERRLIRGGARGNIDGQSGWEMYSDDGAWALGELRGTFTVLATPGLVPRYVMQGIPAVGPSEVAMIDVSDQLPASGRRLLPISIDFTNSAFGDSNLGHVEFELRSNPLYTELPGQGICFHSGTLENIERETGLLMGSQSIGGDRTKCHLPEGEDLFSNGMMVNRHYDDEYLAEFIEVHEWNTFLITVAANDLSGGRPPAVVVDNIERLIDRYRSAWEIASARNKALLEPKFLVVSPHTCGTIVNDEIYATYNELVGSLAGDDVAVCHLYSILQEEYGSVETWGEQLLIDDVHPSELGIRAMADLVWEQIELAWGGASDDSGPTHRVPGERASIAAAAQVAEPGDRILVAKGEYTESLSLGTPGVWFYSVHGPGSAKIIPPLGERCAHIVGKGGSGMLPITFEGFEFSRGLADHGGAALIENAAVEFLECEINECSATTRGGAIAAQQSSLLLQDTVFSDCEALENGGAISIESTSMDAIGVLIKECTAGVSGGGAWAIDSVANLTDSRFNRNICSDRGGGFATVNGFLLATNVLFDLNTAMGDNEGDGSGGGLHLAGAGNLDQVMFDSNFAVGAGGGMRIDTASETIELANIEFLANIAGTRGGGFSMAGGIASMEYSAFSDCVAGQWAAGIHVEDGHLNISLSLFETLEAPLCAAIDAEAGYVGVTSSVFCPAEMMLCGAVKDLGGNEYMEGCVGICDGDMNGDGIVNGSDLGLFFVAWGPCPVNTYCRADFNRDGVVNGGDLGLFLLEIESFPQYCK